ncbi:ABC transporter ATP-binding protein [Dehalobacter sp. DCM]|uniref:ABC transporter ATP-binding protein n=1 Tax=Dehalobacter sp. DCM TaxID=2907827 RepID=UPI003081EEF8|nr:ABC transporter ATP-binding protein [Dehalobacter sp. DCM]
MLSVEGISKQFTRTVKINRRQTKKEEFYAVADMRFRVEAGDIFGILGPNGAGKTTLLRMMGGIMTPTAGSIAINGLKFNDDPNRYKRSIGYLSGNTKLYGRMSPRELMTIFSDLYDLPKHEAEQRIEEIIAVLNLHDFVDNRIENLSTGQTQRVSIARCLIHTPALYIFDEPTLGLDVLSSQSIIDFMLKESKQGKGVVYSTHYMEEAENICNKILLIHKGTAIAQGTPAGLKEATGTNHIRDAFIALIKERGEYHE